MKQLVNSLFCTAIIVTNVVMFALWSLGVIVTWKFFIAGILAIGVVGHVCGVLIAANSNVKDRDEPFALTLAQRGTSSVLFVIAALWVLHQ